MIKSRVVFGPPGCGKSRHLIESIAKFLKGTVNKRVLLVSHTKAAAQTIVDRWGASDPRLDIQTLHSFCFKAMGLSRSQTVDEDKMREFAVEYGLDMDEGGEGKQYAETMSYARSTGVDVQEAYAMAGSPGVRSHFMSFHASYLGWKKQFGYMDFADMLESFVGKAKTPTGHTLLAIDEAQDLTPLHWKVINRIMELNTAEGSLAVIVTGDEDQCLYSYAGADPRGMRNFRERYGSEEVVLEQSHRVPRSVHAIANQVIQRVQDRAPVGYVPRQVEGSWTHRPDVGFLKVDEGRDTLIIYGDKFTRREVEEELVAGAIPYVAVSGMPSPWQTKAGKAIRLAHKTEHTAQEIQEFTRCLNATGKAAVNAVGFAVIMDKLAKRDYSHVNIHWEHFDYYRRVDWMAEPKVRIATIHGSKGAEADDVHLMLAQSQAAIDYAHKNPDASHRLMYVGVTRARERLFTYDGNNSYELR